MKTRDATLLALLGAACLAIGTPEARSQQAPDPRPGAEAKGPGDRPEDVKALAGVVRAFTEAYNKGDAKATADLFTEGAEVTEEAGAVVRGREAIAALFEATFRDEPKATIEVIPETLRFLGADAARETGRTRTTPAGGGTPELSRYTTLYVRKDGRWLQDSVHEYSDRSLTPHERLRELAWMVGEWVDEGDEGVVRTSCRWSDDRNFLLRDFTLHVAGQPITGGSQRIGWDARAGQFRSWVFDRDGGHSEGLWSRADDRQWVIKAEGVLADGKTVTATQVLTLVNKDLARWKSIDRTIGGQAVPDAAEVVLVRTPPRAAGASGSPLPDPKTSRKP